MIAENCTGGHRGCAALHRRVYPIVCAYYLYASAMSAGSFPSTGSLNAEKAFRTFRRNTPFLAAGPASLPHAVVKQVVQNGYRYKTLPSGIVLACVQVLYPAQSKHSLYQAAFWCVIGDVCQGSY